MDEIILFKKFFAHTHNSEFTSDFFHFIAFFHSKIRFFSKKPSAWPIIARRRSDSLRSEVLSEKWGNCGPFCTPKKVIHLVTTVDGRNQAPAVIYETLCKVGYSPYQLVQEFFHQRCRSDIVQQEKITQKLSVRSCRFSISAEEAHLQVEHQPSMNIYPPMALAIDPGDPGSVENVRKNEASGSARWVLQTDLSQWGDKGPL